MVKTSTLATSPLAFKGRLKSKANIHHLLTLMVRPRPRIFTSRHLKKNIEDPIGFSVFFIGENHAIALFDF